MRIAALRTNEGPYQFAFADVGDAQDVERVLRLNHWRSDVALVHLLTSDAEGQYVTTRRKIGSVVAL